MSFTTMAAMAVIRVSTVSLHHQVNAAVIGVVYGVERVMDGETPRVDWWKRMRLGNFPVEVAAQSEHGITNRFGVKRSPGKPPVPEVVGIDLQVPVVVVAGKLVRT